MCLDGVWNVFVRCLDDVLNMKDGVWMLSGMYMEGVLMVCGGRCPEGARKVSGRCLEGV